jgi:hypothetical protein
LIQKDKINSNQLIPSSKSLLTSALPPNTVLAKADSGASKNYFPLSYADVLLKVQPTDGPTVHLADDSTIKATKIGTLPLSNELSDKAKSTCVFDNLKTPLLSLGQLCDDGCEIHLDSEKLTAFKNNKLILNGTRNEQDGLWDVPIPQPPNLSDDDGWTLVKPKRKPKSPIHQKANIIIRKDKPKLELAQWLHASCGSPSHSTFIKAIEKGNFISWPGLSTNLIKKHLPSSETTAKGHLNQERKNLQSTKPSIIINNKIKLEDSPTEIDADFFPSSDSPNTKSHHCFATIESFEKTAKAYSDQTGKFPFTSSRGHKYLIIVYDYDSNAILHHPLKSRTASELTTAWKTIHDKLSVGGSTPLLYILDNEFSTELEEKMKENNVQFQLVPPHIHRRNAAERAIQTFKHHFLAILASCDINFPIREWDRLLDQAEVTLNLLRNSRMNPLLSSYAYLFGNFDFNATPIAPPGTKVQVQIKSGVRGSWSYHSEDGWYVGRSKNHYRCVQCFIPSTHQTRHADTVKFFPTVIPFPEVKLEDFLRQASSDIISILQKPSSFPTLQLGDQTQNAILQIATLLNRVAPKPQPIITPIEEPSPAPIIPTITPTVAPIVSPNTTPSPVPDISSLRPAIISPSVPKTTVPVPRVVQKPVASRPRVNKNTQYDQLSKAIVNALQNNSNTYNLRSKSSYNLRNRAPLQPNRHLASRSYLRNGTSFRNLAQQHLVAQHIFSCNHVYHPTTGKKETIDTLLRGDENEKWTKSLSNEWGRLAQGNIHGVKATDTIDFIARSEVPQGRQVTYGSFVCDFRPLKTEPFRVRLVVGGDKLDYPDDPASPAAGLIETKLLVNSTISDAHKGAKFMSMDLKDHFLASPMGRPEYMKMHKRHIPADIFEKYKLDQIVTPEGYVFIKIKKGMYGLKQAALLAYQKLVTNLAPHGYHPCKYSIGLWYHDTRPTKFCLCVDDFGVKYYSKEDANHLLSSLRSSGFTVSTDWAGKNYCGLTFDWNYNDGYVDISMPNYVKEALHKFHHVSKGKCHAPHKWSVPAYGSKVQYATHDTSELISDKIEKKRIQSIVGTFLYYARAIESPMLPALNEIGTQQSKPTQATIAASNTLLDFAATYPNGKIRFYASDMILHIDSDAAYLVMPNAKSRVAGYFYLSNKPTNPPTDVPINGAILVECATLRNVVGSAAEAECAGCYSNAQKAIPIRIALEELGHPQEKTPLRTDNSTASGFANKAMRQKRSKSWDMKYHWLRDRQAQNQFHIYWKEGKKILADYFTKHFPPSHHIKTRPTYILKNHYVSQILTFDTIRTVIARVC